MYDVSIIIPCLNEEDNIEKCVRGVPELPWRYEIVVVNDGSTDNTFSVAKKIKMKNLNVVGYRKNRGKGYAIRYGIKYSKGKVGVIQDADMATPPEELENILRPIMLNRADFVNGSRLRYPMELGAMKGVHVLGNKIFAFAVSLMIWKRLTDTLCGFKAFRIKEFKDNLKEDTWPDFELILKAKKSNMRIVEVPIHYKRRVAGQSKMKTFSHAYKMSKILIRSLFY